jgi:hypothetical protein
VPSTSKTAKKSGRKKPGGAAAAPPEVPDDWKRWAAAAVVSGMPVDAIVPTIVADGVSEEATRAYCSSLLEPDPRMGAADWVAQRLRKLESLLSARQAMAALDPDHGSVDRRHGLSGPEFLREYYSRNRPVVLDDVSAAWPALTKWTPEYLAEVLGDTEVQIMTGREGDDRWELNGENHKHNVPFRQFVETVLGSGPSNDAYLTANNKLLASEAAAPLWDDFDFDSPLLEADRSGQKVFLWFGPAGTVTSLHHDLMNVLFNQIYGKKEFLLIPSLETHRMYNTVGVYTDIDPLAPDLERFPLYAQVEPIKVILGPGESLFIPVGWWHHVLSAEVSISLSCINMAFPNSIEWENPDHDL